MDALVWLILSKDRPLQLDALLRSMRAMVDVVAPAVVLYSASNERYESAYSAVFERHKSEYLCAVAEQDFRADVLRIVKDHAATRVVFLVDDLVFIAAVNFKEILALNPDHATYSLRLGKRITHCQPLGVDVPLPPFLALPGLPDEWLAWLWVNGKGDWRGANCLDGNVLSRDMLLKAFEHPLATRIRGPQTLEMSLNESGIATTVGICSVHPQLINLAINRVSEEEFLYPYGTAGADTLLERWEAGYQLCLRLIPVSDAKSCHIICDIPLERR